MRCLRASPRQRVNSSTSSGWSPTSTSCSIFRCVTRTRRASYDCAIRCQVKSPRSRSMSWTPRFSSARSEPWFAVHATATRNCICASSTSMEARSSNSRAGTRLRVMGEVRHGFFGAEIVHPRYRVLRGGEALPDSLTPVYPTTAGLAQAVLRRLIGRALVAADLSDTLPHDLMAGTASGGFRGERAFSAQPDARCGVVRVAGAYAPGVAAHQVRRTARAATVDAAALTATRRSAQRLPSQVRAKLAAKLLGVAAVSSSRARKPKRLAQIRNDLAQPHPMQRLLQGDVGSGKTIVAALAALQAVESGIPGRGDGADGNPRRTALR